MIGMRVLHFQRGVTLIELMITLLIGMFLSLAMFAVMNTAESRKRTYTASNDTHQAGNYAMYLIDQWVRNAGNGFAKSAPYSFGCPLVAYRDGARVLPSANNVAPPDPFGSVNIGSGASTKGHFRLAPVLILPGQTTPNISGQASDVLVIMAGSAGTGGAPMELSSHPTAAELYPRNSTAFLPDDLILVADTQPSTSANYNEAGTILTSVNTGDCLIEQVSSSFTANTTPLPLSGSYHSSDNGLSSMRDTSVVMPLGNAVKGRSPQFQLIGVGSNNTLYSYDLLRADGGNSAVARADGVFELHALYGIDKDCNGKISSDEWVSPSDSSYSVSALMAGNAQEATNRPADAADRLSRCTSLTTANDYLQKILAVRVGLIMRTSLPEKTPVTTSALSLFADLGTSLKYTRTLKTDEEDDQRLEQHYRYRTVELTIPLRNTLMLP